MKVFQLVKGYVVYAPAVGSPICGKNLLGGCRVLATWQSLHRGMKFSKPGWALWVDLCRKMCVQGTSKPTDSCPRFTVNVHCLCGNLRLVCKDEWVKESRTGHSSECTAVPLVWVSACFWEQGIAARKHISSSHICEFQLHWQLTSGLRARSRKRIGLFSALWGLLGF